MFLKEKKNRSGRKGWSKEKEKKQREFFGSRKKERLGTKQDPFLRNPELRGSMVERGWDCRRQNLSASSQWAWM